MITSLGENKGGLKFISAEDQLFKATINGSRLVDFHPSFGFFTENNRRGGIHHIAKLLDRFLISEDILHVGGIIVGKSNYSQIHI